MPTRAGASPALGDRFERLDRDFHQRLHDGFLAIAEAEPQRCAVIDAAGEVDAVHRAVLDAIAARLGLKLG